MIGMNGIKRYEITKDIPYMLDSSDPEMDEDSKRTPWNFLAQSHSWKRQYK